MKIESKITTTYTLDGSESSLCCPKCGYVNPLEPYGLVSDFGINIDLNLPKRHQHRLDTTSPLLTTSGQQLCPRCVADYLVTVGVPVLLAKTASEDKK